MKYPTWNFKNYYKWRLFEGTDQYEEVCRYNYENFRREVYNFKQYQNWLKENNEKEDRLFKFKEWLFSLKVDKLLK